METGRVVLATPRPEWLGGVMTLRWGRLQLTFSRFAETRDGLAAEVVAKIVNPGETKGELVFSNKHRLMQPGDKSAVVRRLSEELSQMDEFRMTDQHGNVRPLPWPKIVERSFYMAGQEYRRGEPIKDYGTIGTSPYPTWALKPYTMYARPTVDVAPGATLKTWWALIKCLSVMSGRPFAGFPANGERKRVAFLDYESDEYTIRDRLNVLCVGHAWTQPLDGWFFYKHLDQPLINCAKEVRQELEENDIGYVAIDNLIYALGGGMRDEQNVIPMFMAIREWRRPVNGVMTPIPINIVSHVSKETMKAADGDLKRVSPFGSIFVENAAGMVCLLSAPDGQDPEDPTKYIAVTCEKANNVKFFKPHAYRVVFTEVPDDPEETLYSVEYKKEDIHLLPEFAHKLSMSSRVQAFLMRQGIQTSEAVVAALAPREDPNGKPTDAEKRKEILVRSTLTNLKRREILGHNEQSATWWVLDKHHAPPS